MLSRVYVRLDRPTQITDANGVLITNNFDNLDRLISRTYPDGVERFGFAAKGLVAFTNQNGQVTRFDYDTAQRLIAITNANTNVTRYSYDPGGALTNLLDGKNQKTIWKVDSSGRATNKVDDLGNIAATFGYDAEGNLTTRWTPAKGSTTFAYDAAANLTNIDYPTNADIRLEYDALNRLTAVVDSLGTNRFTYTAVRGFRASYSSRISAFVG